MHCLRRSVTRIQNFSFTSTTFPVHWPVSTACQLHHHSVPEPPFSPILTSFTPQHLLKTNGRRSINNLCAATVKPSNLNGIGCRVSQSLLGMIWRFQSQLHLAESTMSFKARRAITCEDLIQMTTEGVEFLLIDVRDRKDVEITGGIQGAKSIPLSELKLALLMDNDDFEDQYGFAKPDKYDRNIVLYGQGTVKSSAALEIAHKLGYKGVLMMAGGYDEWIEKTHLEGRI